MKIYSPLRKIFEIVGRMKTLSINKISQKVYEISPEKSCKTFSDERLVFYFSIEPDILISLV
jgi:hypothetical protein